MQFNQNVIKILVKFIFIKFSMVLKFKFINFVTKYFKNTKNQLEMIKIMNFNQKSPKNITNIYFYANLSNFKIQI